MSRQQPDEISPKMKRKKYEKELQKLKTRLCLLQDWVKHAGLRVTVVFEGRDAAGKGGTIKAITERGEGPRESTTIRRPLSAGKSCWRNIDLRLDSPGSFLHRRVDGE